MIVMQSLLLHAALLFRVSLPPLTPGTMNHQNPFEQLKEDEWARPYNFWRWGSQRPYWTVLAYTVGGLTFLQLLLGSYNSYSQLLGYVALGIEAILPVPQIMDNHRRGGCKGFRLSVLANWIIGDVFKMAFFLAKDSTEVPWAFKLCGLFQASCDIYLGVQFYQLGSGEPGSEGRNFQEDVKWLKERGFELMGLEN